MNTKLRKITKIAAIAVFIMALGINIKVTLDDPFGMVSNEALADGTGGETESCWVTGPVKCKYGPVEKEGQSCAPSGKSGTDSCYHLNGNTCTFKLKDPCSSGGSGT